jgi:hypothetical protein
MRSGTIQSSTSQSTTRSVFIWAWSTICAAVAGPVFTQVSGYRYGSPAAMVTLLPVNETPVLAKARARRTLSTMKRHSAPSMTMLTTGGSPAPVKRAKSDAGPVALIHLSNLDIVARGEGTENTLWHLVEAALTWSRAAELLQAGMPEMAEQLDLARSLVLRYGRTGRVLFTGGEYQLATDGVAVMDQLAEMVDQHTALAAAAWSEAKVAGLKTEQQRMAA